MNSCDILAAIEEIAATSSKNAKETLVKRYATCAEFVRVLEYAYNPSKTYGIRQMPNRTGTGFKSFDATTWQVLDELIKRKLTGNEAREVLAFEINSLDASSADLLIRIIRKDLRAGFSESTCNKAVKGLIPDFPYMRCCLPKDAKMETWIDGAISQEKADGMFGNVDHEVGGLVRITSRQGSEFPIEKFANIERDVRATFTPGMQQHGEFLVKRNGVILERQIGNGILNSVLKGGSFGPGEEPVYMVWDQVPLTHIQPKGKYEVPYSQRLAGLITQLKAANPDSLKLIKTRVVRSMSEAHDHYREMLLAGKEGTVVKNPKAIWKDGTSKDQVKLKLEVDVDLKIVAIVPGRVGTKNEGRAGSFTCVTSCGGLVVDVTVKNEDLRDRVDENPDEFIEKIIPVRANSILLPSESNEYHSLFLPRMVEADYRMDKTEADSLQRVFDQFESAVEAA